MNKPQVIYVWERAGELVASETHVPGSTRYVMVASPFEIMGIPAVVDTAVPANQIKLVPSGDRLCSNCGRNEWRHNSGGGCAKFEPMNHQSQFVKTCAWITCVRIPQQGKEYCKIHDDLEVQCGF